MGVYLLGLTIVLLLVLCCRASVISLVECNRTIKGQRR